MDPRVLLVISDSNVMSPTTIGPSATDFKNKVAKVQQAKRIGLPYCSRNPRCRLLLYCLSNPGSKHSSESCFNKHDGPSDRATDLHPMLSVHSRMVRHPVRRSVLLIETAPGIFLSVSVCVCVGACVRA